MEEGLPEWKEIEDLFLAKLESQIAWITEETRTVAEMLVENVMLDVIDSASDVEIKTDAL